MPNSTVTEMKNTSIVLSPDEQGLVDQAFNEAKDFRSIGERITSPIDEIVTQTAEMIKSDPIMDVSAELAGMNSKIQSVYSDIINDDGVLMAFFKKIPLIGLIAEKIDSSIDSTTFEMKEVEGKIATIFSGFDQSYTSLNLSIEMQKKFLDGIESNLAGIIAYKNYLSDRIEEFKTRIETADDKEKTRYELFLRSVEFFQGNLVVLIGNLGMAEKRLLVRMDAAQKLSLAMNSSKPIFKTMLSTAVIEVAGQKAIDVSMKAMEAMGKTIDELSASLTDKAIEGSKRAETVSSKPILSSSVFIENVTKLKNHFDEMEIYRTQIANEAKKEREEFVKAEKTLSTLKVLGKKDSEELEKILEDGLK